MPTDVTNYKCPACTGPLHFSENTGKLECDYCGSSFSVEEIEIRYRDRNAAAAEAMDEPRSDDGPEQEWDPEKVSAYQCPSCSAQLILEKTAASAACPYCGNPTIVPGQLSGSRKPDLVIPFKFGKQAAIDALRKHYRGKLLLPKAFSEENHIQEIKGVYVPFWLYDVQASGDMTFHADRIHTHSTATENITETDHYIVRRRGSMRFERVPADASKQMPDTHMDAIEPFDYRDLKPFSLSYLPGFMANRYDVTKEENVGRIKNRCQNSMEQALRNTVTGYNTCVTYSSQIQTEIVGVKYAMLPVWMLSTRWNGQNFLFAMNGQTGKLIGDLPISKKRLVAWVGGAFAAATVLLGWLFL